MNKQPQHNWVNELVKLKSFAKEIGFPVIMGTEDQCNFAKKQISLNRNRTSRNQVYVLAHEIGHVVVRGDNEEKYLLRFPGYACAKNTKGRQVSKIEEEVLAWVEARKILIQHDVPVDETAFSRIKQICLGTYLVT